MSNPQCEIRCHSLSPHLQQLYTGFSMLHSQGRIRLKQTIVDSPRALHARSDQHLNHAGHAHLDVVLDGSVRLHFDTHDAMELAEVALDDCDIYFKRSYCSKFVGKLAPALRQKVFPLGLNYNVYPDSYDLLGAVRGIMLGDGIARSLKRALDTENYFGYVPRLRDLEARPENSPEPRILFLARAHSPEGNPDLAAEKSEERREINETRAKCIRLLRKRFGDRFTGGFESSSFANEKYPDLVVRNQTLTSKRNYLSLMKRHHVCIATNGLHGSNGWKLAEYVSCSKAILSEPLRFEVPGTFAPDRNYLEFSTPEECIERAEEAMLNDKVRMRLMENNAEYYQAHLRPDKLVLNALSLVQGARLGVEPALA